MTFDAIHRAVTGTLKTRVLILTAAVLMAAAAPAYVAFNWIVNSTILQLGTLFAEKQVLFDRYRGMETLLREVSFAETLTRSAAVREWAADESTPEKMARGLAELESFRAVFRDNSYFFVVHDSGNYYFNDRANSYAGQQKRYTVDRANPRDGWYFATAAMGPGCKLNVDHDDNLSVTKVWINCVIVEGSRILGVLGTGVDLTAFIREVVDIPQPGVQSMFVDASGAIQAHRDPRMVDFHSLTKDTKSKNTIYRLLDDESDRTALAAILAELGAGGTAVTSRFMRIGGQDYLVGVGYLDRLGWYNVMLMDLGQVIDCRLFLPIAALLAALMAGLAVLMTLLFKRSVLDRLARLEVAAHRVQHGDYAMLPDRGNDEIGRLSQAFTRMAAAVGDQTHALENLVRQRTEKLQQLAHRDELTEIHNRRGFIEAAGLELAVRGDRRFGILLIDMDLLKTVNDTFGHQWGDRVIAVVARRLEGAARRMDICGRWGGDEFIALIVDCDEAALRRTADRVLAAIADDPLQMEDGRTLTITVSIGAAEMAPDDSLDAAVARADIALYDAKRSGRRQAMVYDPARHAGESHARSA